MSNLYPKLNGNFREKSESESTPCGSPNPKSIACITKRSKLTPIKYLMHEGPDGGGGGGGWGVGSGIQ